MTVKMNKTETQIEMYSPYHPDLPSQAKKLGGRWNGSAWVFDSRDMDRVKELYRDVYGSDGDTLTGDLVTLRVKFPRAISADKGGIYIGGRCIGSARGRDTGARLSDGIVVLEGNITSGGSMKNWTTVAKADTVIEIRDMPREKAQSVIESCSTDDNDTIEAEIIEAATINSAALTEEKNRLLQRIAEIDALLAGSGQI